MRPTWSLVDIGINLTDGMYRGTYNHKGAADHPEDIAAVVQRALAVGVTGLLITGGSLDESRAALGLAASIRKGAPTMRAFSTVGTHPTRCSNFLKDPAGYYAGLRKVLQEHSVGLHPADGVVAAVGEVGLDYDRLHFCPKDVQLPYFVKQLELAAEFKLPLFLHDRNTGGDFYRILAEHRDLLAVRGGVVHSFTGTADELAKYLDLGLYVSINGCSLKTAENLAVAQTIPLDRLLIETDGPYCEIKNTHASRQLLLNAGAKGVSQALLKGIPCVRKEKFVAGAAVKGRNEPCYIVEVLEAMYLLLLGASGGGGGRPALASIEAFAAQIAANSTALFGVL